MKNFDYKKKLETKKRRRNIANNEKPKKSYFTFDKLKKFIKDPLFIVIFLFFIVVGYIEFRDFRESQEIIEAYDMLYENDKVVQNKQREEYLRKLADTPFEIRSKEIQTKYDKCINGDAYNCYELANHEESQGHIRNFIFF